MQIAPEVLCYSSFLGHLLDFSLGTIRNLKSFRAVLSVSILEMPSVFFVVIFVAISEEYVGSA